MSRMTRAELKALCESEITVSFETACRAFGVAPSTGRELHRRGEFPIPVLRLGRCFKIRTTDLKVALIDPDKAEAGPATGPANGIAPTGHLEASRAEYGASPHNVSVLHGGALRGAENDRGSRTG